MTLPNASPQSSVDGWKKCSLCKKPIAFGATFYTCSVSTCKNPKVGMVFCTYSCFDGHLGPARHRQAWAEEATAPGV